MNEEKREKLGKIAVDLMLNKENEQANAVDIEHEAHVKNDTWLNNIHLATERGLKQFPKDFYIVHLIQRPAVYKNVVREYFFPRESCPTPDYDQSVLRYHRHDDVLEYLWTIPSRELCIEFKEHALEIPSDQQWLLKMVFEFADGTLYKMARQLNGEGEFDKKIIIAES